MLAASPTRREIMSQPLERELRRELAVVMFTDMAGYTALMQRDEAAALWSRKRHRTVLESCLSDHGGELLQYFGDGSLSIFRSSLQAVEAAVAIQRELEGRPALRIGLHAGEIAYDEQGAYGDAVNIAARLEALSVPGGILVSDKIFDDIRRHPRLAVEPKGPVRLKNVADAVETFAVAVDGVTVPPDPIASPGTAGDGMPPELVSRLERHGQSPRYRPIHTGTFPGRAPLVGRDREIRLLKDRMERAEDGHGGLAIFRGARGVGKTRLAQEAAEFARSSGWTVLWGRAYAAEKLVPFAPVSDAFLPLLQGLPSDCLEFLAPGGQDALRSLFPVLGSPSGSLRERHGERGELRAELFWHLLGLVTKLTERHPVLIVFEDLDFADRSSLELISFLARQAVDRRVFVICQYVGTDRQRRQQLLSIQESLMAADGCVTFDLEPLPRSETDEFVRRVLGVEDQETFGLAGLLHQWTGGNAFFLTGSLRGLIESGVLRREAGSWKGLEVESLQLPHSVRDTVLVWMVGLSESARQLAELLAVIGRQVSYEVLRSVSGREEADVALLLEELTRHQILMESADRWDLLYDFRHPLIRETLRSEIPLTRRRGLHALVAEALEAYYGDHAEEHADELAYHFGQANASRVGPKAVLYLSLAGRTALTRNADGEAATYLQEALDRTEAARPGRERERIESTVPRRHILSGLARARRREGEIQASLALWRRLLAEAADDRQEVASIHRQIGIALMAGGMLEEAIDEFDRAREWAEDAGDLALVVRVRLAQGMCYHATGRGKAGLEVTSSALALAEQLEDPALLGRVHSAFLRLHIWTGQLDRVRSHAEKAMELSRLSGDRSAEFWSLWALGAMEGLIGNTPGMAHQVDLAQRLADELGSPFLRLETTELSVELAYARGQWERALDIGLPAIDLARSLGHRSVLTRLLVWVSRVFLGRSDFDRAEALTQEAWEVSEASSALDERAFADVHSVVPAHVGRALCHLAKGEWGEAIRTAEGALSIADRTGYVVWAIHHILPIIAEAAIRSDDLDRAAATGRRMRVEAELVGHPLGFAWADACDAVLAWLEGNAEAGAASLRQGAESLETIPLTYEAARLRRQLAGRLAEVGDREGALLELGRVHHVFEELGAKGELQKTVEMFREMDVTPPGFEGSP